MSGERGGGGGEGISIGTEKRRVLGRRENAFVRPGKEEERNRYDDGVLTRG